MRVLYKVSLTKTKKSPPPTNVSYVREWHVKPLGNVFMTTLLTLYGMWASYSYIFNNNNKTNKETKEKHKVHAQGVNNEFLPIHSDDNENLCLCLISTIPNARILVSWGQEPALCSSALWNTRTGTNTLVSIDTIRKNREAFNKQTLWV